MGNEDKQKTFVKTKFSEKPTTFAERIAFSGEKSMGHLIASTRTPSDANLTDFAAGNNPITNSTATAATGDNGQAQQLSAAGLSYSFKVDTSKVWKATQTKAGSYSLADMLYSSQDGYDFTSMDVYTITPKTLQTIKLVGTIDKKDDTTNAADLGNHYQLGTDVLSGDVVLLSGEGHYEDAIVGDNKKISFQICR